MTALQRFFSLILVFAATAAWADSKEIPYRADSGLTKTEYLLSAGQFSAAIDTAGAVLQRHPDSADAYTYRGYAYAHLGEMETAAQNFRKALLLEPTHLGANKYLATLYLETGDLPRAIEQMQVIRMTCGSSDCEELRALESEIDRYRRGEKPAAPATDAKTEDKKLP